MSECSATSENARYSLEQTGLRFNHLKRNDETRLQLNVSIDADRFVLNVRK